MMNNQASDKHIVILGGGTAGWIAANLMASHLSSYGYQITLIESPNIGTIGVGEGSTPPLKEFMDVIGAKEEEWMPQCNATYKVGISFANWSDKPGFERFFHTFLSQTDEFTAPAFFHNSFLRRKGIDLVGLPDPFFINAYMAEKRLAPVCPENFPFEINYGYHFDSALLGKFLHQHAAKKGVNYRSATIQEVKQHPNGDIAALLTDQGEEIHAELFVDSSGFDGLLIQKTLNVPYISFNNNLFNDSAVVFSTEADEIPAVETVSTALKNGWAWKIPLTNRYGNGYVYSSNFCSQDDAETEFREHLGLLNTDVEARHLKMKVGRVENQWINNCLAVGLSQGFVEPLEATALDMVQETVVKFIEAWIDGKFTDQNRKKFNDKINHRFEAVRDFIVAHYKVSHRSDSEYWLANRENNNLSRSLYEIISAWMQGKNITDELERQKLDAYFGNISWNSLFAGSGLYPTPHQLKPGNEFATKYDLNKISEFIRRCSLNFIGHKEQLELLDG